MSEKPNTTSGPITTGFVLCERVVGEFHTLKRSPSLAKWEGQLKAGVEKFLAENANPKAAKEAQVVQTAFALAQELTDVMKSEAASKAKRP